MGRHRDTPALQRRSPALWGPSSHPSASPAAPGTGEYSLASVPDPPLRGSPLSPRQLLPPQTQPARLSSYLQLRPSDDVPRVQHIPQGLAHLPALPVPDHGVQKHLGRRVGGRPGEPSQGPVGFRVEGGRESGGETSKAGVRARTRLGTRAAEGQGTTGRYLAEGELPRELGPQHDHAAHPEQQEVTACLQKRQRVEAREVWGLGGKDKRERPRCHLLRLGHTWPPPPLPPRLARPHLLGPAQGREGEKSRREPRVQDIGVCETEPSACALSPTLPASVPHPTPAGPALTALQGQLGAWPPGQLCSRLPGLGLRPPDHPAVLPVGLQNEAREEPPQAGSQRGVTGLRLGHGPDGLSPRRPATPG